MFKATPFKEWYAEVKIEFAKAGLQLPEDMEIMELAHMECLEEEKSIAQFVQENIAAQKG